MQEENGRRSYNIYIIPKDMHAWVVTRLWTKRQKWDEKEENMIRVEYWRKSYFETLNPYNLKCINSSTRTEPNTPTIC